MIFFIMLIYILLSINYLNDSEWDLSKFEHIKRILRFYLPYLTCISIESGG